MELAVTPKQIEGLIELALGIYLLLVTTGTLKLSKNPEANAKYILKWRWVFIIGTIFLLVRGGTLVAGLDW